jgi:hypothetical protein
MLERLAKGKRFSLLNESRSPEIALLCGNRGKCELILADKGFNKKIPFLRNPEATSLQSLQKQIAPPDTHSGPSL